MRKTEVNLGYSGGLPIANYTFHNRANTCITGITVKGEEEIQRVSNNLRSDGYIGGLQLRVTSQRDTSSQIYDTMPPGNIESLFESNLPNQVEVIFPQ